MEQNEKALVEQMGKSINGIIDEVGADIPKLYKKLFSGKKLTKKEMENLIENKDPEVKKAFKDIETLFGDLFS